MKQGRVKNLYHDAYSPQNSLDVILGGTDDRFLSSVFRRQTTKNDRLSHPTKRIVVIQASH
jgi:hypothetical protein